MTKTLVIKVGTSSLIDDVSFVPNLPTISALVTTVSALMRKGHRVVLVSSGAVGMGVAHLKLGKRPKQISKLQAVAAVGQGKLMALYSMLFSVHNLNIAQILLTRDNVSERSSYLNAKQTLKELLDMGVIPFLNENDSVSSIELRFGDNDTMSALVAGIQC